MRITLAKSVEERAAVFAFRYEAIAREQGIVADPSIVHANRTVIDPADDTGLLFAAWENGVLAGTVRANMLRDGPAEPYDALLGIAQLPEEERWRASVTSRLVVSARWRGTPLCIRLAQACYRYGVAAGVCWDYILVRAALVKFYSRLGYQPFGAGVDFSGVGRLIPMRLNLNSAYLQRIRSVLRAGPPSLSIALECSA